MGRILPHKDEKRWHSLFSFPLSFMLEHLFQPLLPLSILPHKHPRKTGSLYFPTCNSFPHLQERNVGGARCWKRCLHRPRSSAHTTVVRSTESNVGTWQSCSDRNEPCLLSPFLLSSFSMWSSPSMWSMLWVLEVISCHLNEKCPESSLPLNHN